VSPEDEHLESVGAGLELTRGPGTDPQRVQFDQLHQLVVELDTSRTCQHDVDLLGLAVSVSEGLAAARLDGQIVDAGLFYREIPTGETSLLCVG
jgi:hypothetical protein